MIFILRHLAFVIAVAFVLCGAASLSPVRAQEVVGRYEGRVIQSVEVEIEGAPRDSAIESELRSLLLVTQGSEFSAVRVRESLQALFDSQRVSNARVVSTEASAGGAVLLRFIVQQQVRVAEVVLDLSGVAIGANVSEDELRARLNMLEPGARLTPQAVRVNADLIQTYLRDRGFFLARVDNSTQVDPTGTRATVVYAITPGEQSLVDAFNINITGFDDSSVRPTLVLQQNAPFSRATLSQDLARIREAIISSGFLAPQLEDAQVIRDATTNRITIRLSGAVGPRVNVAVENYELSDRRSRELLPVRREGTIDESAIEEGRRRLRNRLQEDGYFFAEVNYRCAVNPPLSSGAATGSAPPVNSSGRNLSGAIDASCENLNSSELSGRGVTITYTVERGRRFKLTDIRITGTNRLSIEDVQDDLRTRRATVLGIIPFLGYGRGYTSLELLEQDRRTVRARMFDLGYRSAEVTVRQGVSIEGENLIITFAVTEGRLTRVAGIEVRGNQLYTAARLREERCRLLAADESCLTVGEPFARSQARTDGERIRGFYARNGYVEADVRLDVVDLPRRGEDEQVRLIYTITEGEKVYINRIFVNGNIQTHREAILEAIPLREGQVLRADQISLSERTLYNTGAFRQVVIRTESAGENAAGYRRRDVIIDVEELKPRDMVYGFGYSTDNGPLGIFEIRHNNLFGQLRQGALRARMSRRRQLLRLEYFDPRFRSEGEGRFSPLALSAQYQRDTNVTRFFRSTIDRGNFGIVQRFDEEGNPIDQFGERTGEPTINRFVFNAETQRVFDRRDRNILFVRYSYEDVRLYNIESLLIADVLRPDSGIRISRLGASFARDTRDNPLEPTRGEYLNLDYSLALRQLGGNISFSRLRATYQRYYKLDRARGTLLVGGLQLGLANLFSPRDRNGNGTIDEIDRTLPISERFFSGGSSTLRGFGFEEAGPRTVITPTGTFRNREGEIVQLNPFTVPVGGNGLVIVTGEARIPVTREFQVVPFYDGGNVFRRVGDIFGRELQPGDDPNLRARFTHTIGLGLSFRTPFGSLSVDYAFMLNPPEFLIPQGANPPAIFRLPRTQLHFRFGRDSLR